MTIEDMADRVVEAKARAAVAEAFLNQALDSMALSSDPVTVKRGEVIRACYEGRGPLPAGDPRRSIP